MTNIYFLDVNIPFKLCNYGVVVGGGGEVCIDRTITRSGHGKGRHSLWINGTTINTVDAVNAA